MVGNGYTQKIFFSGFQQQQKAASSTFYASPLPKHTTNAFTTLEVEEATSFYPERWLRKPSEPAVLGVRIKGSRGRQSPLPSQKCSLKDESHKPEQPKTWHCYRSLAVFSEKAFGQAMLYLAIAGFNTNLVKKLMSGGLPKCIRGQSLTHNTRGKMADGTRPILYKVLQIPIIVRNVKL